MSVWNPYQSGTSYDPNGKPVPPWLAPGQSNHYGRGQSWTTITTDSTAPWTVGQPAPPLAGNRVYLPPPAWHWDISDAREAPVPMAAPDDEDRRLAVMYPLGAE